MTEEQKYTLTTEKGEVLNYSAGFSGKGIAVYPNGDIYDGEFVDGVRQGKGKYTYGTGENPDKYEGLWHKNEIPWVSQATNLFFRRNWGQIQKT